MAQFRYIKRILSYAVFLFLFVLNSQAHAETFTLGIVVPLSGDLAEYGTAIRNGFELAKSENPERFSNIKYIYEDSRYDGKAAVDALQKLRSLNTIDLYYLWGVSPTEAMLPIVNAQKLPVIAETTIKEATVGKPLVVRAARTGERIAKALANELERRKLKSISMIVTEIPFYLDIMKHLEAELHSRGIAIRIRRDVLPSLTDFRSFFLDRSASNGETVGVFLLPSQIIAFYKQAEQLKLNIQTFNADILDSETIVNACPENINGAFFTQVGINGSFRERYKLAFGNDIQVGSAAQAYDVADIISGFFGNLERKLAPEEIIKKFSTMSLLTAGETGLLQYSETPDGGKEIKMPVSIKFIHQKKIVTISENAGV